MSVDKKAILEQIEAEFPKIDAETKKRLEGTIHGGYDYTFYRIVRLNHADQIEVQYRLLEKILNQIKAKDPKHYMEALKHAFKQVKDYCISNRETKIAPLLLTLIKQVKNIDPTIRGEFFAEIKKCYLECYIAANTLAKEIAESHQYAIEDGGDLATYNNTNKWPLHVIVDSVREILPELTAFLVSEFRSKFKATEMTIEQMLNAEITPLITENFTWHINHIQHSVQNIIDHLANEWEYQYNVHSEVFDYFEKLTPSLCTNTMDFLGLTPALNFMPQYARISAGAGSNNSNAAAASASSPDTAAVVSLDDQDRSKPAA